MGVVRSCSGVGRNGLRTARASSLLVLALMLTFIYTLCCWTKTKREEEEEEKETKMRRLLLLQDPWHFSWTKRTSSGGFRLVSDQWRLARHRRETEKEGEKEGEMGRKLMADGRKNEKEEDEEKMWTTMSCSTMKDINEREFLRAGWTKAVYSARYKGRPVAVKVVNTNGHDVNECVGRHGMHFQRCYRKSAAKIVKEIVLLQEIVHNNVLKVLGYCVPNGDFTGDDGGVVAMVTELGEPLDIIKLLQMSWEDRLRICLGIARLLFYLSNSPLGSLAMNDFRRQQFVLINGEVKLSDVDDVGLDEASCPTPSSPCFIPLPSKNSTLRVDCVDGLCRGYNEKLNVAKAGRHFINFLLPHGAPKQLQPLVSDILRAYNTVSSDSKDIVAATEHLVDQYVSGNYLRSDRLRASNAQGYKMIANSDLPGQFDYQCQLSLSGNGCTLAVFDVREAQDICSTDFDCKAFVMTNQSTWTGRKLVHFKNNFFSSPSWNSNTTIYVKQR